MDLNGSELNPYAEFEVDTTGWLGVNSWTDFRTTSARSHTGLRSMVLVANDIVTPVIFSSVITNATANKFTVQVYCIIPSTNSKDTIRIGIYNQSYVLIGTRTTQKISKGAWVPVVVNALAPGTQTGFRLGVELIGTPVPSGDSLYVDGASLTQAYDGAASVRVKTSGGSTQTIAGSSVTNSSRLRIWQNTATASASISDGTTTVTATNSATVNDGREHKWDVTWSRTGNLTLYIDGVAGTGQSITGLGAITVDTLWIGRDQAGNYFNGTIGEKLRVRYSSLPSDIASWIAYAATQRFIPEPPGGGETVLRVFGRRPDAYDQSGNQGTLTNTGSTPIIPKQ